MLDGDVIGWIVAKGRQNCERHCGFPKFQHRYQFVQCDRPDESSSEEKSGVGD